MCGSKLPVPLEPVNLILVGCGRMGQTRVCGYAELERVRPGSLRLRAVCDTRREAAEQAAADAEQQLGCRPSVFTNLAEAIQSEREIEAADIVTDNRAHDAAAVTLLDAGVNVLVEKPLAVTVARARRIVEMAHSRRRLLAVAENDRRDPMNRLLRHVVQSGFIGRPHFVLQAGASANLGVHGTPWRHRWAYGGLALDAGIHLGYLIETLMGPLESVYAVSQRVWPLRAWKKPDGGTELAQADAEDVFSATLTFINGAQGTWTMHFGSPGAPVWQRIVFGTSGTVEGPPDRSGRPVRVHRGKEVLEDDALVRALPDFRLNDIETRLFGERPGHYALDEQETDRKLIAAGVADFLDAIRERREPEVTGDLGLRSVAIVYAVVESAFGKRPVQISDIFAGDVRQFQDGVEAMGG